MGFFKNLFLSYNEKEIARIEKIVDKIESLEEKYQSYSEEDLKNCTQVFKDTLSEGTSIDEILPDAFAVVREASSRVLGMRHYRVQLIGGIVLHEGRIAEMRTGEGKTLVATLAAYVNALTGKGVHIVTVNEYLAKRDAEWMGKIFRFLGLTVGVNLSSLSSEQKKQAYACDILYSTNNELGFDYLRDNMVKHIDARSQRGLVYAIIDEVDSILIDEARTPLIISGKGNKSSENYKVANRFVKTLKEEDYELSEKDKSIFLNENGAEKAEKYFDIENLADYENQDLKHYIDNALKANYIMKKESNYLVVDDEIVIIDEFTGRQMIGRRYSNGLHQAIEAKENVTVKSENKTMATITFQNYFRIYNKLSGMTGTAKTEASEFKGIYGLEVVVIPPNKPTLRVDENDQLYINLQAKYNAVMKDIIDCYTRKQPVLVGTVSVENSELLSKMLSAKKIPHKVLNAKNHQLEAEIVAQAGKSGAVTVATNMAGRGTDILLGGNPEFLAKEKLAKMGYPHDLIEQATSFAKTTDPEVIKAKEDYNKYYDLFAKDTNAEKQMVIEAGGLRIIGTERHESRRIDNQLRGRSGRQGDVGSSVFYLSMEDDIMRIFGGEQMMSIAQKFAFDPEEPIVAGIITKQIQSAQARVEDRNFSIRKHVIGYDDVMNKQREIVYAQRRTVLENSSVHKEILGMLHAVAERMVATYIDYSLDIKDWDYDNINKNLENVLLEVGTTLITRERAEQFDEEEEIVEAVYKVALEQYEKKILAVKEEVGIDFDRFEKDCMLYNVDQKWMDHIDAMDELKQGIGLVAYAQRDPVIVYKQEGFEMFDHMVEQIQDDTIKILCKSRFEVETKTASKEENNVKTNDVKEESKPKTAVVGRNDKCPCGSGKKYKNCCGKE